MPSCFVPVCQHTGTNSECKWLRFPRNESQKKIWICSIRRKDKEPNDSSVVCSCHFVDGKRENGPTLFSWNESKRLRFPSPEKAKKRSNISSTNRRDEKPSTSKIDSVENLQEVESNLLKLSLRSSSESVIQAEAYFLEKENQELKKKLEKPQFSYAYIKSKKNYDELIKLYTGLPNDKIFRILFNYLSKLEFKYYLSWNVVNMEKIDEFLICLMKLKLNPPHQDLALRFGCSIPTISNIFLTWVYVMHEAIFKKYIKMPSRQKNRTCMPSSFACFTNCRIIVDCTEIQTVIPSQLNKQRATYSSYKHRNTLKGFVAVAPNGVVTFVSAMYAGSVSDKKIVGHCGILELLESGDLILADKGFLIKDLLPPGVSCNIPSFLSTPQFTAQQILHTKSIAKARIHVERAIQRIKIYKILTLIPQNLQQHVDVIWQVCATLTNFQFPLIKELEHLFTCE